MKRFMLLVIMLCWFDLWSPSGKNLPQPHRAFSILKQQESLYFQNTDGVWFLSGQKVNPQQIQQLQQRLQLCDDVYNVEDNLTSFLTLTIDNKQFFVGAFNQISKRYPIQHEKRRYFCAPELISLLLTSHENWLQEKKL